MSWGAVVEEREDASEEWHPAQQRLEYHLVRLELLPGARKCVVT